VSRFGLALVLGVCSCRAVVGADGEHESVVEDMCRCDELRFLGTPAECASKLEPRLAGATEKTRAEWLKRYANECATCPKVLGCYYTAPTCSLADCTRSEECCGYAGGEKCDETSGECAKP